MLANSKPGTHDPASLAWFGPTIEVSVGFDPNFQADDPRLPTPNLEGVLALIDTGASDSCIDIELAEHLQLPKINRMTMIGATGQAEVDLYLAQVIVPVPATTPTVMLGQFAGLHIYRLATTHRVLLGRDILRRYVLGYNGQTGEVTLRE